MTTTDHLRELTSFELHDLIANINSSPDGPHPIPADVDAALTIQYLNHPDTNLGAGIVSISEATETETILIFTKQV